MVTLSPEAHIGIVRHAEEGYPYEVCGVLIGRGKEIETFRKCRNINTERAHDRYELDPGSFLEADGWARENGMEILGIYHSHPDHPSLPSETDRARAWPGWIYLIVSVFQGRYRGYNAWILRECDWQFEELKIIKTRTVEGG